MSTSIKVYVPQGSLGVGLFPEEIDLALARAPDAISLDAGSTDSGAAYLAKGMSKNDRNSVKRDLELLMRAQRTAEIPLLIGTTGQAGGDLNVDWTRDIVLRSPRRRGTRRRSRCSTRSSRRRSSSGSSPRAGSRTCRRSATWTRRGSTAACTSSP